MKSNDTDFDMDCLALLWIPFHLQQVCCPAFSGRRYRLVPGWILVFGIGQPGQVVDQAIDNKAIDPADQSAQTKVTGAIEELEEVVDVVAPFQQSADRTEGSVDCSPDTQSARSWRFSEVGAGSLLSKIGF